MASLSQRRRRSAVERAKSWRRISRVAPVTVTEPLPSDIQPVANETLDRTVTGLITVLPMVALGIAGWQLWQGWLHPSDLAVFGILYVATGLGVTVGFHRLLTHRAFKTKRWVRAILA